MIPRTIPTCEPKSWQEELSNLITDPEELFALLRIDRRHLPAAQKAHKLFPLRVTRSYAARIKPGDLNDPLLRQILPIDHESLEVAGFSDDPLQEAEANPCPGIVHKYSGRVLLISATQCAINCRYCFRRHFDYSANTLSKRQMTEALNYIRRDEKLEEVILSGGDPLASSDKQLSWLIDEIELIPHVERLRIHSRLPIVAPSRITPELVARLKVSHLNVILVIHSNHERELDDEVMESLTTLKEAGIMLLNQSVLLKGVNDDAHSLVSLSKRLFKAQVLPYYLHVLDKVQGAAHFYVDETRAKSIQKTLLSSLPGYLVPKLVREDPQATSKTPVI